MLEVPLKDYPDKPGTFDVQRVRADFPVLQRMVYENKPLVYLDNAATSQKPRQVLDRLQQYYTSENSNVHRGVHRLSQEATDAYEGARKDIAGFIGARHTHEVIFTKGTTDSINLVASTYGRTHLQKGDEVLLSTLEHHSNIVPWQMLCEEKEAHLRVIPLLENGALDYEAFLSLLSEKTRILALAHVSNSLGTVNPVAMIIKECRKRNIAVLLDGAQAVPHMAVDVQALDVDFYAFSSHKMCGPTGVGVLYGKSALLEAMPPYQGGGDMIADVSFEKTTYNELPHKFEAGTPNISGVIGLGAAVHYLQSVGMEAIAAYESELLAYGTQKLSAIPGLDIIGTAPEKASVLSFLIQQIHPYDAGSILDRLGIAVRTGHHCTQPLMDALQIPGTVRASLAFYNTREEIDTLVEGLGVVQRMLG